MKHKITLTFEFDKMNEKDSLDFAKELSKLNFKRLQEKYNLNIKCGISSR